MDSTVFARRLYFVTVSKRILFSIAKGGFMKSFPKISRFMATSACLLSLLQSLSGCGLQGKSKSQPAPAVNPSGKSTDANGTQTTVPCRTPTQPSTPWNNPTNTQNPNPRGNPDDNGGPTPWGNPDDNGGPTPWGNPGDNGGPTPWGNPGDNGGPAPWENPEGNGDGSWNWGSPESPVLRNVSVTPQIPWTGQTPPVSNPNANPQQPNCTPRVQDSGLNPISTKPSYQQLAPVFSKNCSGANCHSTGSRYGAFVGNQYVVDSSKSRIYDAVASGRMPKYGSLSAQDRNLILSYTKQ